MDTLEPNGHALDAIETVAIAQEKIERAREVQLGIALDRSRNTFISVVNEQYTNIMTRLALLDAGQQTTNTHLAILNGKVATHEERLTTLLLWKAEAKGFIGAINFGWTAIIALFSGALGFWLFKK